MLLIPDDLILSCGWQTHPLSRLMKMSLNRDRTAGTPQKLSCLPLFQIFTSVTVRCKAHLSSRLMRMSLIRGRMPQELSVLPLFQIFRFATVQCKAHLSSRLIRMSVIRGGMVGMTQELSRVHSCLITAACSHLPSAPCQHADHEPCVRL